MLRTISFLFLFLVSVICVHAQTANQYIKAGDKAMLRQDYFSAISYYASALKQGADELVYGYTLADANRLFHSYDDAEKWYRNTLQNDQENKFPLANFWLAMVLKKQMRYAEAETYLNDFIQNPVNADQYFKDKALVELKAVKLAPKMITDSLGFEVNKLPSTVNSKFSEFAPFPGSENKIYFSSIRYLTKKNIADGEKCYISKIVTSDKTRNWSRPRLMSRNINEDNEHSSNAVISKNGELMFFTRCNAGFPADVKCKLYYSKLKNGRWQKAIELPEKINKVDFTTTQPSIVEKDNEYIIYFVSDRSGGSGKTDIWYTIMDAIENFSEPANAGNVINTPGDEASPFYDDSTETLYFSSDYHIGIGGFDIFKSKGSKNTWTQPVNIGFPLNSSYDDLYYSLIGKDYLSGFLASNRPGSEIVNSDACCYDIYSFNKIINNDSIVAIDTLISSKELNKDALENNLTPETKAGLDYLKSFLPLELYFHNDEPDSKTLNTTTKKSYDKVFYDYIKLKEEYRQKYSEELTGNSALKADALILRFFEEEVDQGMQKLNEFAEKLLERLNAGDSFTLKLKGYTSPLAATAYNTNLAHRRISSLMNYFSQYNGGAFFPFLNKQTGDEAQLILIEEPIGETTAPLNVSDDVADKRKSVYSPEAAAERRIEIIAVDVNQ